MTSTFAVGDIVQLKSGGETMTVEEVAGDDISCVWFNSKKLERQTFAAGTLKVYVHPSMNIGVTRG